MRKRPTLRDLRMGVYRQVGEGRGRGGEGEGRGGEGIKLDSGAWHYHLPSLSGPYYLSASVGHWLAS